MAKPEILKDLIAGGFINLSEIKLIARTMFDGETTAAGPEGYVITAAKFDDLPDACQQFIVKAILEFSVENVLDAEAIDPAEDDEEVDDDDTETFKMAKALASRQPRRKGK